MTHPVEAALGAVREAAAGAAGNVLSGLGMAKEALRAVAREAIRPELQELGIDHLDPFNPAGELAILKARNRKRAEAQAAKWATIDRLWEQHDRALAMPLSQRFPELATVDTGPDPEGVVTGRYRSLNARSDETPPELLKTQPELTPEQVEAWKRRMEGVAGTGGMR